MSGMEDVEGQHADGAHTNVRPFPPRYMFSQHTTNNGLSICQPTCNVNKLAEIAKLDLSLADELAEVQRIAYSILEGYGFDGSRIERFLDFLRDRFKEDEELPSNNERDWPPNIEQFVEAVERACEIQVNSSVEPVRKLLHSILEDGEKYLTASCIEILLRFKTSQLKIEFIKKIMEGTLSKEIAVAVYSEVFCSKFTTPINGLKRSGGKLLDEWDRSLLQDFLEKIRRLISIHIYFRVAQLVEEPDSEVHMFEFTVAASKLVMAGHDTAPGDNVGICKQISEYLKQAPEMYRLFQPCLAKTCRRRSSHRESTSSSLDGA